jgi:hypothetical protein
MAITGISTKPIKTTSKSAVTVQPAARITSQPIWYHIDCSAWKATLLQRSR